MANTKNKYPVTLEDVCDDRGYFLEEVEAEENQITKRNIERLIRFSDMYLQGAVGEDYPRDDERAKQIALLVISDLYDNRELDSKDIKGTTRKILNDLEWQLKLELIKKNGNG